MGQALSLSLEYQTAYRPTFSHLIVCLVLLLCGGILVVGVFLSSSAGPGADQHDPMRHAVPRTGSDR